MKKQLKNYKNWDSLKEKFLKDKEIKTAYEALKPEYALIRAVIKRRLEQKMSQKELAKRLGTKQSAISRLESGKGNPTVSFLRDLAGVLGGSLEISLKSVEER
ncbi:MAG: helix-turn-helix transcriptional regulator [Candidatus Paceibacterota bacterium]